jgi:sugar/nucleoside kinase (ribokinase family)
VSVDVVTIGGCTVDIVRTADGQTRGRQLGGNAIYAAAGARLWGLRPGVVAFRGTGLPETWSDTLGALQIDIEGMVPVDVPASVTEFFYDSDGRRVQRVWGPQARGPAVPYLPEDTGEPIRRLRLAPEHIPPRYLGVRGAHLAPISPDAQRAIASALTHVGILTLDPHTYVMAQMPEENLRALLTPVAAFLPSREEALARFPDLEPDVALQRLAPLSRRATVIKLGAQGALVYDRAGERRYVVPAVPIQAKDPTGAGDAFCGGFLAALVEGESVVEAAARGAVSASFVVEEFGLDGIGRASPAERDRRVRWVLHHVQ